MLTLPNILTLIRIALIPVLFLLLWIDLVWSALALYSFCAITDFLDGYIARKFNQISAFGTFLDPISDKIFVGCLLVILVAIDRLDGIWIVPVMFIFTREFLISGLREFLGPKNVQMPVTSLAKWKTASQMLSIGFLIVGPAVPFALFTGQILLGIAATLTTITGLQYLKAGWSHLQ